MKERYLIKRTCNKCGKIQTMNVSKRASAFELYDTDKELGENCEQCNTNKFTTSVITPNIDVELINEWATNPNLQFMEQDEELLLADEKYLNLILHTLDNSKTLKHKQAILMDSLCIIVYDNSSSKSNNDLKLKNKVIVELNKRKGKLKEADEWIMDYIKEIVFPQLDLEK